MTASVRDRILFVARRSSLVAVLVLAACGQPAASAGKAPWPGPFSPAVASPTVVPPVSLPRDESPHDVLTEWWYYTGHLRADDGTRYGFESVIFQSSRGDIPRYYAAHIAITDRARQAFRYDQRTGPARSAQGPGFDLRLGSWEWRGLAGRDQLVGSVPDYAFALDLTATKPPALHSGGYFDYGPAGGTYYYSRTRMAVRGTLDDHGVRKTVTGEAWFDHQWGNFLPTGAGGWDWFSIQLEDGTDVMVYRILGAGQTPLWAYATFVEADGRDAVIGSEAIQVEPLTTWTSPRTGVTYPATWRIALPDRGLFLTATPTLPDQELDTRASTGQIYWEGEALFEGTRNGRPVRGEGYIELTGYDRK